MVKLTEHQKKVAIHHATRAEREALEKKQLELETALSGEVDIATMSPSGLEALGLEAALSEEKVEKLAEKANEDRIAESRQTGHMTHMPTSKSVEKPEPEKSKIEQAGTKQTPLKK